MQFDLVFKEIGEFGRFSKYIVFVGALTNIYSGFLFLITLFTLGIPDHRCAVPGWENDTYAVQDDLHLDAINRTIPMEATSAGLIYDKCNYITVDEDGRAYIAKCNQWVYDKSIYESTLAAKLNMVCDRSILKSNAQMAFFCGLLSGSLLLGIFSDRFGRKPTICISSIFYFLAALGTAWTPSFTVLVIFTFCVGFFATGNFMPAFVMEMEFVGPTKRKHVSFVNQYAWVVGNAVLAGLAYGVRNWKYLQIICAAPGVLFQLFWMIFPESPRWLYTQGRIEESKAVIRKAAKWQKVDLSANFLDQVFKEDVHQTAKQKSIFYLFTSRILFIRTMIIYLNWIVVCLTYYGLALNSGDLGVDMYLSFFFQTLIDVPAGIIVVLLLDRTGRKPLLVGGMVCAGLGCLSTVFVMVFVKDSEVLTTVLAMVGKLGASSAFTLVFLYSTELFPTVVRNAGIGSGSCVARVGGMIAPYIADLDRLVAGSFGRALPQIVYGSLSIIAGLLALNLPETLGRDLPETIEDGEMFGREIEKLWERSNRDIHVDDEEIQRLENPDKSPPPPTQQQS